MTIESGGQERRAEAHGASAKIVWLFSMTNCIARFLACMSLISRSMLRSRIMVGAKTTAKFLGDIYERLVDECKVEDEATYQVLRLSLRYTVKMEHQELEAILMALRHSREGLAQVIAPLRVVNNS